MDGQKLSLAAEISFRLLFLCGAGLILSEPLRNLAARVRMHNRLRARKRLQEGKTGLLRHLDQGLLMAFGKQVGAGAFLFFDGAVFFAVLLTASTSFSPGGALCAAALTASIPWLIYVMRLEESRRKGSREGVTLVTELLRRYRISGGNIFAALEETVGSVRELKVTGKLLYRLLLNLRQAPGRTAIGKAAEDLAYGLGTNWGRMLAYNLAAAARDGRDITVALEDLLIQLRDAESLAEERKRLNGEAMRMTGLLIPVLYPVTIALLVGYLGLPLGKVLQNQFYTPGGLLLFLLILFLWAANGALLSLFAAKRFDF